MPEAIDVRRKMYGSEEFRLDLAERLNNPLNRVGLPLDALLRANVIPSELDDNTEALRVEATKIVLAIASQVQKPEAIPTVVERFGAMTLQAEPASRGRSGPPTASSRPTSPICSRSIGSWRTPRRWIPSRPSVSACFGAIGKEACCSPP